MDGTPAVHDLADPTGGRRPIAAPPPTRDLAAVFGTALAALGVVVAAFPGGGALPHWTIGLGLAALALLVAVGALRRARRLGALILPVTAVLLSLMTVVALMARPADAVGPAATTVSLPRTALLGATGVPAVTGVGDPHPMLMAMGSLVQQLQLIRTSSGAFPAALALNGDRVAATDGVASGAALAVLPPGTSLTYAITADHQFFRITLTGPGTPPLAVSADSTVGLRHP